MGGICTKKQRPYEMIGCCLMQGERYLAYRPIRWPTSASGRYVTDRQKMFPSALRSVVMECAESQAPCEPSDSLKKCARRLRLHECLLMNHHYGVKDFEITFLLHSWCLYLLLSQRRRVASRCSLHEQFQFDMLRPRLRLSNEPNLYGY